MRSAATKRLLQCVTLALLPAAGGCVTIAGHAIKYGVQHSIGARMSVCQASKDSVQAIHGKPYRRYFSDAEDLTERTQLFWHEWGYRIPGDSVKAGSVADSTRVVVDSVRVIGFRWGDGLSSCDVRERRVLAGTQPGVPWEGAGDVPEWHH